MPPARFGAIKIVKDTVKYFYQDDVLVEYVPLDDGKASDDGN